MSNPIDPGIALQTAGDALAECLISDRRRLRRRLKAAKAAVAEGRSAGQLLTGLDADIRRSCEVVAARREMAPNPEFPAELPITARRHDVARLISRHQVVILCGETGSGKSTQLPKICLDMGRGIFGRIGHTQPRRIAARSLASRISACLLYTSDAADERG